MDKVYSLIFLLLLIQSCSANGGSSDETITTRIYFHSHSDVENAGYFNVIGDQQGMNPTIFLNYSQYAKENPQVVDIFKTDTLTVDIVGKSISYEVVRVHGY